MYSTRGFIMRRAYIVLLLLIMGWLNGPGAVAVAQETTSGVPSLPYEDAPESLSDPPTPRFLRLEVDFSTAGVAAVRLPLDPAWVDATRPTIRLEQVTGGESAENVALPVEGGAEELDQFLEQALDQSHPVVTPGR
jgi:hypothetical protein